MQEIERESTQSELKLKSKFTKVNKQTQTLADKVLKCRSLIFLEEGVA